VWVYPANLNQAILSTPLIAILLVGLLIVPFLVVVIYGGFKPGRRTVVDPWACGYGYSPRMSVSASSFDQPIQATFHSLYVLRPMIQKVLDAIAAWSKRFREVIVRSEPLLESWVTRPTARAVEYLGDHIQALQMGDIRVYCLYIILTLAVLLIVIFK
jgi:hydrogenase-4 component B